MSNIIEQRGVCRGAGVSVCGVCVGGGDKEMCERVPVIRHITTYNV